MGENGEQKRKETQQNTKPGFFFPSQKSAR